MKTAYRFPSACRPEKFLVPLMNLLVYIPDRHGAATTPDDESDASLSRERCAAHGNILYQVWLIAGIQRICPSTTFTREEPPCCEFCMDQPLSSARWSMARALPENDRPEPLTRQPCRPHRRHPGPRRQLEPRRSRKPRRHGRSGSRRRRLSIAGSRIADVGPSAKRQDVDRVWRFC